MRQASRLGLASPVPPPQGGREPWGTDLRTSHNVLADGYPKSYGPPQELNGFLLINPSPFTFDFSFGSPMYQIMPAPDTSASSSSLAFTVT